MKEKTKRRELSPCAKALAKMLETLNAALQKREKEFLLIKKRPSSLERLEFHYVRLCCIKLQELIKKVPADPKWTDEIIKIFSADTKQLLNYIKYLPCQSSVPGSSGFLLKVPVDPKP